MHTSSFIPIPRSIPFCKKELSDRYHAFRSSQNSSASDGESLSLPRISMEAEPAQFDAFDAFFSHDSPNEEEDSNSDDMTARGISDSTKRVSGNANHTDSRPEEIHDGMDQSSKCRSRRRKTESDRKPNHSKSPILRKPSGGTLACSAATPQHCDPDQAEQTREHDSPKDEEGSNSDGNEMAVSRSRKSTSTRRVIKNARHIDSSPEEIHDGMDQSSKRRSHQKTESNWQKSRHSKLRKPSGGTLDYSAGASQQGAPEKPEESQKSMDSSSMVNSTGCHHSRTMRSKSPKPPGAGKQPEKPEGTRKSMDSSSMVNSSGGRHSRTSRSKSPKPAGDDKQLEKEETRKSMDSSSMVNSSGGRHSRTMRSKYPKNPGDDKQPEKPEESQKSMDSSSMVNSTGGRHSRTVRSKSPKPAGEDKQPGFALELHWTRISDTDNHENNHDSAMANSTCGRRSGTRRSESPNRRRTRSTSPHGKCSRDNSLERRSMPLEGQAEPKRLSTDKRRMHRQRSVSPRSDDDHEHRRVSASTSKMKSRKSSMGDNAGCMDSSEQAGSSRRRLHPRGKGTGGRSLSPRPRMSDTTRKRASEAIKLVTPMPEMHRSLSCAAEYKHSTTRTRTRSPKPSAGDADSEPKKHSEDQTDAPQNTRPSLKKATSAREAHALKSRRCTKCSEPRRDNDPKQMLPSRPKAGMHRGVSAGAANLDSREHREHPDRADSDPKMTLPSRPKAGIHRGVSAGAANLESREHREHLDGSSARPSLKNHKHHERSRRHKGLHGDDILKCQMERWVSTQGGLRDDESVIDEVDESEPERMDECSCGNHDHDIVAIQKSRFSMTPKLVTDTVVTVLAASGATATTALLASGATATVNMCSSGATATVSTVASGATALASGATATVSTVASGATATVSTVASGANALASGANALAAGATATVNTVASGATATANTAANVLSGAAAALKMVPTSSRKEDAEALLCIDNASQCGFDPRASSLGGQRGS